jgi:hypothetical protein
VDFKARAAPLSGTRSEKGAAPAHLLVEQPSKIELVIAAGSSG